MDNNEKKAAGFLLEELTLYLGEGITCLKKSAFCVWSIPDRKTAQEVSYELGQKNITHFSFASDQSRSLILTKIKHLPTLVELKQKHEKV